MIKRVLSVGLCAALASAALVAGLGPASPALSHDAAPGPPGSPESDPAPAVVQGVGVSRAPADDLRQFVNDQAIRLRQQQPAPVAAVSSQATPLQRLTHGAAADLAAQCAPATPQSALVSIAQAESGLAPLAIRINGRGGHAVNTIDKAGAIATAHSLIDQGRNLDLGLAQINSRNLGWLGLSVEDAFDPCRNLAAAARILDRGYAQALRIDHGGRPILQMAYSLYNSGDVARGWSNGYVARVEAARRSLLQ